MERVELNITKVKPKLEQFGIDHGLKLLSYYKYYNNEEDNMYTKFRDYLKDNLSQEEYDKVVGYNYNFFLNNVNKIMESIDLILLKSIDDYTFEQVEGVGYIKDNQDLILAVDIRR